LCEEKQFKCGNALKKLNRKLNYFKGDLFGNNWCTVIIRNADEE